MIGADLHFGSSLNNVIHLIFVVWFLGINAGFRQNVDAGTQGRYANEFHVALSAGSALVVKIVNVEEVGHEEQFSVPGSQFSETPAEPMRGEFLYLMLLRTENREPRTKNRELRTEN